MAGKTTGGKKKPAAKKAGSARTKPRTSKTSAGAVRKKSVKGKPDKTPLFVLTIMALLTVIAIMLISNYRAGKGDVASKVKASDTGTKDLTVKNDADAQKQKKDKANEKAGKEQKEEKAVKNAGEDKIARNNKEEKAGQDNKDNKVKDSKDAAQSLFYIYLVKYSENSERMSLQPVKRNINSASPLKDTLNELIKGPSRLEKKKGLLTAIPDDLRIRNVHVVGKNAVLDFNDAIESNANGEILLTRIDQLVYTATQFEGIESVIFKVNGKQKKFLGGDGLSVSGPVGRRGK
ncbi:MAG: GerMN domain-containing protein [Spirochaetota bacterium]